MNAWRFLSFRRAVLILGCACLGSSNTSYAGPLEDRRAAIERAFAFLRTTASDEANVDAYGSDLLWCFYTISHTSRDRGLSALAARTGRELARRWRASHQHVPSDADADQIYTMVMGAYAADRLGVPLPRLKPELRAAAARFSANDFLGFDAPRQPPSPDDPMRYDTWLDALIRTYFGDAYGVLLGAHYSDVIKWLPRFRPFDGHDEDIEFDAFYAVTHVIYTLNGYNERRVSPSLLPAELPFLRRKLDQAMADDDPQIVGEALDSLKAAGFENDRQVRTGMDYLVATQLDDGAWVEPEDDLYTAYHSAWTGIDGLRDYRYGGTVRQLPGTGMPSTRVDRGRGGRRVVFHRGLIFGFGRTLPPQ